MTTISSSLYFWLLLKASLFSMSGMGNLPSVHADFTSRGWADERDFLQSLTIGQISPGPTGLWVVSFGYLTYGMTGALLAVAAILLPPMLVLPIRRAYSRLQSFAAVEGFVHGLGIAAVGTFACVLIQLLIRTGISGFTLCVVAAAFGLATVRRLPSIAILGLAAVMGIAAGRI